MISQDLTPQMEFQRALRRAVLVPIFLGLIIASLFLLEVQNLHSVLGWVDHTDQTTSRAHHLLKLFIDAETGARGFNINKDEKFLEPYNSALKNIPLEMQSLKEFVADNPAQVEILKNIDRVGGRWLSFAKVLTEERRRGAPLAESSLNHKGKDLMDEIRRLFDNFVGAEEKLRILRIESAHASAKFANLSGVILALLLGIILAFSTRRLLSGLSKTYQKSLDNLEQKASELYESREWFQTTLTSIGDAVIVVDRLAQITFINPVAEKLTGWSRDEAKGLQMNKIFAIVNEKTREPAFNPVDRVLREGIVVGLANHTVLIGKNGNECPIEDSAAPIKDANGHILGVILVFRDVTERYFTEAALRESEERFRNLADVAPVLIWTSGEDRLCDWFNQVWLDFTGRKMEEEVGNGWIASIHGDDLLQIETVINTHFIERKSFETEFRLRRHDGIFRWVLGRGLPRYTRSGTFLGYIGSCIDITEKKDLMTHLEHAVRSRDEFLSIASHELKTPLTTLTLQLQMSMRNMAQEKIKKVIEICFEQTKRLNLLIDGLLDVTRIQQGRLQFNFELADLAEIVHKSVNQFQDQLESAKCGIEIAGAKQIMAMCDPFRIEQVVTNLLSNAMKYAPGKVINIKIGQEGSNATFSVTDRGLGIPKEKHSLIFERFERAVDGNAVSGLGLGLYIVKQIVSGHDGNVEVQSTVGQGSTFLVTFPLNSSKKEFTATEGDLRKNS